MKAWGSLQEADVKPTGPCATDPAGAGGVRATNKAELGPQNPGATPGTLCWVSF